jgi:trimeric autotransporter adhesin
MKAKYFYLVSLFLCIQISYSQVGIGTTSPNPSSELDVSSPLNDKGVLIPRMIQAQRNAIASPATSLLIYQTDNTPGFYYYNGTIWVGITAGASTDWTLLGNAATTAATNFLGTTDDVDFVIKRNGVRAGFIGNPIGATATTVDRKNTSFGANSLLTPAGGYRNTAIGTNALTLNNTGLRNVAIGNESLAKNDSGNTNVAVGDLSMFENLSGNGNTAVGTGSLYSNKVGTNNTAIGRNALTANTASFNTALGDRAMEFNSTGNNNVATGNNSLNKNVGGNFNTATGVQALRANQAGSNNTALGYQSLSGNPLITGNVSTYANSTAVGYQSLYNNLAGDNNTAIGSKAGFGATGANNIIIGANAEVPVLANNDQLSIGNVIYGTTMTSTTAGKIGVGEANPNAKLQITSSNQATPAITDGILIPKVDNLTATPTASQQGMLVYLTTLSGTSQPGFYYWNNSPASWIGLLSSQNGDHDWYKVGTTIAPTAITDDMFHTGNVAIGKNTILNSKLEVENTTNTNSIATNNTVATAIDIYGINNQLSGTGTGYKRGVSTSITGSGASKIGVENYLTSSITSATSSHKGIYNVITNTDSSSASSVTGVENSIINNSSNNPSMGVYNAISSGASAGIGGNYGIYNLISGYKSSGKFGVQNTISSNVEDSLYGINNSIISSANDGNPLTNGVAIGISNTITLNNDAITSGNSNYIGGTGHGNITGVFSSIDNIGNGDHTGIHSILSGTGTGSKTGTYTYISPAAGGTHYGVFADVLGAGNYAGRFIGNVTIGTNSSLGVDNYILPAARATSANQIMQTDGVGNVTWQTTSAILNSSAWLTTGNSGMTANFIGTTDANPLRFFTSNTEWMRIAPTTGEVVIGSTTPVAGEKFSVYATGADKAIRGYSTLAGLGIYGLNNGSGWGVLGKNTGNGRGVEGGSVGTGVGVIGFNTGNGAGVLGKNTGIGPGVQGDTTSATGNGIVAANSATAGTGTGNGVLATTIQSNGFGVNAQNTNTSGTGLIASGQNVVGSYLIAGSGAAVTGNSTGLFALTTTPGVSQGILTNDSFGGITRVNYYSGTTQYKILGTGTVSTTARGIDGERVVLHCTEAPEIYFEDYGQGQLIEGKTHIIIDPIITKNIIVNDKHPLRVYIQLEGDCNGVFVTNKRSDSFDVIELASGKSNVPFQYHIIGNRADEVMENGRVSKNADTRFELAPIKLETKDLDVKSTSDYLKNLNPSSER